MSFHAFKGQRTGKMPEQRAFSQASLRDTRRSFDQHGRPWSWPADKATGMPCGSFTPEGWNAPWLMDQGPDFYVLNPDNTAELFLNYRSFARSRIGALKEFHDMAIRAARKGKMPIPKIGQYPEELLEMMGQEPPRAYQIAVACEQNNPWALGFDERPDPRLTDYLEGPSTVVEEAFEAFDFSAETYADEVGGRRAPKRETGTIPRRFKSFAELKADMESGKTAADDLAAFERTEAARTPEPEVSEATEDVGETISDEVLDEEPAATTEPEPEPAADEDPLEDLNDSVDAEALGGKKIDPRSPKPRSARSGKFVAAAPPRASSNLREFKRGGRPSLADGAKPVIG